MNKIAGSALAILLALISSSPLFGQPGNSGNKIPAVLAARLDLDARTEQAAQAQQKRKPPGYPFGSQGGNPFVAGPPSHGAMSGGITVNPTLYAVDVANEQLLRFNASTPGSVEAVPLQGVNSFETFSGIDIDPATGLLYGIMTDFFFDWLVVIDPDTGHVTRPFGTFAARGIFYGFDIDPSYTSLAYLIDNSDRSISVSILTGNVIAGSDLNYVLGDSAFEANPNVVHLASAYRGPASSDYGRFGIDSAQNTLVSFLEPRSNGGLSTIGPLGVDTTSFGGFDIKANGPAYAALRVNSESVLHRIDLATGQATPVGPIGVTGPNAPVIDGLAIVD